MTPARRRNHQAGFTLVELMVTVFIVGLASAIAMPLLSTDPSIEQVTRQTSSKLREAARVAGSRGPIRDDVQDDTGSTARTQVEVAINSEGRVSVKIFVAVEDETDPDFDWEELSVMWMPANITLAGYSTDAKLESGNVPDTVMGPGTNVEFQCYPTGGCDPMTLFLQNDDPNPKRVRIALMPINGAPQVFSEW